MRRLFLGSLLALVSFSACTGGGGADIGSGASDGGGPPIITEGGAPLDTGTPVTPGGGGKLDPAFANGSANVVGLALQPDGKIVFAGAFNQHRAHTTSNVGRVNADGTVDTSFTSSNTVTSTNSGPVVVLPDGKILVGGNFSGPGGNRIVRLGADGVKDATFNAGGTSADGAVGALALQPDGKVLVGGSFTSYNGGGRRKLVRINADGTLDPGFTGTEGAGPLVGPFVRALAVQPDGKVIVGGSFDTFDGVARADIARLNPNGSVDISFVPGASGEDSGDSVNAVAVQPDGKVLVGGNFRKYNGTAASYLVRLNADGSLDASFASAVRNVDGELHQVNALALQGDGKIYVGGNFETSDAAHADLVRLNADGSLDRSFTFELFPDPTANPNIKRAVEVNALVVQPDGKVVVGGDGVLERLLP